MTQSPIAAIRRIAETEDQDRLRCAAMVFNAYRESMEVLGGRRVWTPDDVARLGSVLFVTDELKPSVTDYARSTERKDAA